MAGWQELADLLERCVPKGRVTRYGDLGEYFFDRRSTQAIGAMLGAWIDHDPANALTHRVVQDDGSIYRPRDLPDQRALLAEEGVPFDADGRVDLTKCPPVELPRGGRA